MGRGVQEGAFCFHCFPLFPLVLFVFVFAIHFFQLFFFFFFFSSFFCFFCLQSFLDFGLSERGVRQRRKEIMSSPNNTVSGSSSIQGITVEESGESGTWSNDDSIGSSSSDFRRDGKEDESKKDAAESR